MSFQLDSDFVKGVGKTPVSSTAIENAEGGLTVEVDNDESKARLETKHSDTDLMNIEIEEIDGGKNMVHWLSTASVKG